MTPNRPGSLKAWPPSNPERSFYDRPTNTAMVRLGSTVVRLDLPDADSSVLPGVAWGSLDALFTPAYWKYQAWLMSLEGIESHNYSLGQTLGEEVAACLLGGYGIPAEVGLGAFERLRDLGLLSGKSIDITEIRRELSRPLYVGGRYVHYRFSTQKSRYLTEALLRLSTETPPAGSHRDFRRWLMTFSGIGPKTSSWITRNWLSSDEVAIIDVHIYRGGLISGLFTPEQDPQRHYFDLESRFLEFSHALSVRPSLLDSLMWRQLRILSGLAIRLASQ